MPGTSRCSYVFHCSVRSYKESSHHKKDKVKKIRFDLEVCFLPRLEMLGKYWWYYMKRKKMTDFDADGMQLRLTCVPSGSA